tara:strand:+ start:463 stop:747 length:285 start_codon:yes stop_codon:yes gene_type:complete
MEDPKSKPNEDFDFKKLPAGTYYFTGQEGFVKIEVAKDGQQSWDLENWFTSLDPDKDESQRCEIIKDIKTRINLDKGTINQPKKKIIRNFLNSF